MSSIYAIGDTRFVKTSADSVSVIIPRNISASIALHILKSAHVNTVVNSGSKLIISLFCGYGDLDVNLKVHKGSVCVQNTSFYGNTGSKKYVFRGYNDGRAYLNNILFKPGFNADVLLSSGENCGSIINCLSFTGKNSDSRIHITNVHDGSNSSCNMNVLGILDEGSLLDFTGEIGVCDGAFGSESALTCRFVKHRNSVLKALPALKIHNKDAKVSHSISVFDTDNSSVEYLMSRGISEELSRKLVERGYVEGMLKLMNKTIGEYDDCKKVC